jgi:hypothetical protein
MSNTALVLLAGKQLIPNLQSITHFHFETKTLERVFIYHTGNERESLVPAKNLLDLCRTALNVECFISGDKQQNNTANSPDRVADVISQWMLENRDIDEWILNATGGTKIMAAGMYPFAGQKNIKVIYREISGGWFEIIRGNTLAPAIEPFAINESSLDWIPAKFLLAMQAGVPPENCTCDTDTFRDIDVKRFTESLIKHKWDWRKAYSETVSSEEKIAAGFIFERYIAAILFQGGIENTALNLLEKDGFKQLEEIDVASVKNGVIMIIDCKLMSKEDEIIGGRKSFLQQVREATATKQKFGGLGAKYVMLRPSMSLPEDEKTVAENAGLIVLDQRGISGLLLKLFQLFGIKQPNENIAVVQSLLGNCFKNTEKLFLQEGYTYSPLNKDCIFPLQKMFQEKEQQGQNWLCYKECLNGNLHIEGKIPPGYTSNVKKVLKAVFKECHSPSVPISTKTIKNSFHIIIASQFHKQLAEILERYREKPLL